jgi:hypothetical protein
MRIFRSPFVSLPLFSLLVISSADLFGASASGQAIDCQSHFVNDYKRVNGKSPSKRDTADYCDCLSSRSKVGHPVSAHQFCWGMIEGIL